MIGAVREESDAPLAVIPPAFAERRLSPPPTTPARILVAARGYAAAPPRGHAAGVRSARHASAPPFASRWRRVVRGRSASSSLRGASAALGSRALRIVTVKRGNLGAETGILVAWPRR